MLVKRSRAVRHADAHYCHTQDENLIAFYASQLNDSSAIESYARFLQSQFPHTAISHDQDDAHASMSTSAAFGPETDLASRQAALLKAREHGLDLKKIACRTVELILSSIREDLPAMSTGSAFDAYAGLTLRELELIRSLEWLSFDRSTYPEALVQANALIRYFLCTFRYRFVSPASPLSDHSTDALRMATRSNRQAPRRPRAPPLTPTRSRPRRRRRERRPV